MKKKLPFQHGFSEKNTGFLKHLRIYLFVVLGIFSQTTYAQSTSLTVTGKLYDSKTNEPLIGGSVVIKGTSKGVSTDANGKYSISVPNNKAVLVFRYLGYNSSEMEVGAKNILDVALVSASSDLAQVVVMGYGTQKQRDVTGSVKSVKSEAFNKGIINSPEQLYKVR
jgi:iron complex outermembrane receptor protein